MMNKLMAIWAKLNPYLSKVCSMAYNCSQLACGIAIGYFGHGLIKLLIDALSAILKLL